MRIAMLLFAAVLTAGSVASAHPHNGPCVGPIDQNCRITTPGHQSECDEYIETADTIVCNHD